MYFNGILEPPASFPTPRALARERERNPKAMGNGLRFFFRQRLTRLLIA